MTECKLNMELTTNMEIEDTYAPKSRQSTAFDFSAFGDRLSQNKIFEVLSNERRRCALYYLQQQDDIVDLGDVVDHVTAWQYDQPISAIDSKTRTRVYSALHQVHLPKLEEAGLIEYDRERSECRAREEAGYAQLYLEYDPGNDIPWSMLYSGLVLIGVILGSTTHLGIYPFDWLGSSLLVWMLLVLFGIAAAGHVLHERRNKVAAAELFEVDQ